MNTYEGTTDPAIKDVTMEKLADFFEKLLETFKKILAWLGILVLPDDDEKGDYPKK